MYAGFLTSELKKWVRDSMMLFMLVYPLIFAVIGRWGLPWIADVAGFSLEHFQDVILAVLAVVAPHIYGAIIGFSILDDRDDNILISVKVTPLSVFGFLSFRLVVVTVMSFATSLFIMVFSHIGDLSLAQMAAVAFLSSLIAPMSGLLINAIAANKIEGFVALKGIVGIMLIFSVIGLFFFDAKELLFAIAPGFWPAKVISSFIRGEGILFLTTAQYYGFGLLYIALLNLAAAKLFSQRVQI